MGVAGAAMGTLLAEALVTTLFAVGFIRCRVPLVGEFLVQLSVTPPYFDVELSRELAREWAQKYLLADEDIPPKAAHSLSQKLTEWEAFRSHNRHIHREKARELGFPISVLEEDDRIQDIVLSNYHAATLTHDNQNVAKIIETHKGNAFIMGGRAEANQKGGGTSLSIPARQPPEGPSQS
jgi:hypothetical protein